jgi:hypothetical protein
VFPSTLHGLYPKDLAEIRRSRPPYDRLTLGTRLLLVGDATAFNYPRGTLYASAWEMDPLVRIASQTQDPAEIIRRLRAEHGVTHILVNWSEIDRLGATYGWWDTITPDLINALFAAGAVDIPLGADAWYNGRPVVEMLALP